MYSLSEGKGILEKRYAAYMSASKNAIISSTSMTYAVLMDREHSAAGGNYTSAAEESCSEQRKRTTAYLHVFAPPVVQV